MSSRPAWFTQPDPVSKKTKQGHGKMLGVMNSIPSTSKKKKKKRANQPKQTTTKTKATEIRGVRRKTECVHAPPALEEDSHSWAWREKMSTVSE
jgi:hypothetical protein